MKKKLRKTIAFLTFLFYILILVVLLFLANRDFANRQYVNFSILEYAKSRINLIPFRTIWEYISSPVNGTMNWDTAAENLLGNLMLFMPMGFYLPLFTRTVRSNMRYFVTMLVMLLCIEALQLLMMRGSFDIDDMILNLAGAMIGFLICQTKPVKKLIRMLR